MPAARKPSRQGAPLAPEKHARVSSAAVLNATGRTWSQWLALLDAAGALTLPHRAIAALLRERHRLPGWWAQTITVGYEQARGRRVVGQTCAGDFSANASKTIPLDAATLHAWLAEPRKRARWLDPSVQLRQAAAPRSARFGFPDGSIAGAWISAKGANKCSVGISHDRLPDAATAARHKAFWQSALRRLAATAAPAKK